MTKNSTLYPHSAITTWSGFIYQGQIAILHCMKLLTEDFSVPYNLQIDSLEDFGIISKSGSKFTPISLHQVKALKSSDIGSYRSAFNKLNAKHSTCSTLYFHTAQNLSQFLKTINGDFPNISIYQYDDGDNFCALHNLNLKLSNTCIKLYTKLGHDAYKHEPHYIERTIHHLTHLIINAIIEVHSDVHKSLGSDDELAYKKLISFDDFRSILNKNLNEIPLNSNYYKGLVIEDFHRYFHSYCYERELREKEIKTLEFYVNKIMQFSDKEMEIFIKGIIPHRNFKFDTLQDYKDGGLQKGEMEDLFFYILEKLPQGSIVDHKIQWTCSNGVCHNPTTITSPERNQKDICVKIIRNGIDTDVITLFEGNTFITEHLETDSIWNDASIDIPIDTIQYNHILKAQNIRLTKLESAEVKINAK